MRVLVISNMYPSDASPVFGAFVSRQVDALRAAGVQVELAVNLERANGPIANLLKYLRLGYRARRAAASQPDIVHAHYLLPTAIFGGWASKRAKAPLLLTAHGDDVDNAAASGLRDRVARALRSASAIVAVSEHLGLRLRERFDIDASRLHVLDCGVDTSLFKPLDKSDARVLCDLPLEAKIVVYGGHLSEAKGIWTLLSAHEKLIADGEEVLLVVAGEGPLERDVQVARDRSRGRLRVLGEVPHQEMPLLFSAADVVSVPSHREGFGLVALESLACGTPVVASDVGGLPEVVRHGVTGRLVAPADPEALADALLQMLQTPPASFEEAARRTAEEHSLERTAARLVEIYESVLAERNEAPGSPG